MTMITFHGSLDCRTREVNKPTVARITYRDWLGELVTHYIVIGTAYGHIHTSSGAIKQWNSYSGARRAARKYQPGL